MHSGWSDDKTHEFFRHLVEDGWAKASPRLDDFPELQKMAHETAQFELETVYPFSPHLQHVLAYATPTRRRRMNNLI